MHKLSTTFQIPLLEQSHISGPCLMWKCPAWSNLPCFSSSANSLKNSVRIHNTEHQKFVVSFKKQRPYDFACTQGKPHSSQGPAKGTQEPCGNVLEHQHLLFCLHSYLLHIATTCTLWFVTWLITHLTFKHWQTSLAKPPINPLKMKCRLLYLKTQSVPRSKHFSSRL